MANRFLTFSNEALKNEIEHTKKRIASTNSQQDKLLLFAMETEMEKRIQESKTSDATKFQEYFDKLTELSDILKQIELEKISGETILSTGVLASEILSKDLIKINQAIQHAKQTE